MSREFPTNNDDVIYIDDIEKRIEFLEVEEEPYLAEVSRLTEQLAKDPGNAELELQLEEAEDILGSFWDDELNELRDLRDQVKDAEDPLIRDSYFSTYAEELASDLYGVENHWPFTCIDWDSAAEALQMDYTSVDFDGVDYWVRA